jgi:hypothetical protein
VSAVKQWSGEAIEAALAAQGIAVGTGRAERLARGQQALLDVSAADPLREELGFDTEPAGFGFAMRRCKTD